MGTRIKVTKEVERAIKKMASENTPKAAIARVVHVSRVTVYEVLKNQQMEGLAS